MSLKTSRTKCNKEKHMQFVIENKTVILAALLAISEVLALIPSIKANGIFDGIVKALKFAKGEQA